MAIRPVFVPQLEDPPFFKEVPVEFKWIAGMAQSQVKKCIASLHGAAELMGLAPVLEISTKSVDKSGVALSAFNLQISEGQERAISVECAFQGSKVFEHGGPFTDLYWTSSRCAKQDPRIREHGLLTGFNFFGHELPAKPQTAFYDWLYARALAQNPTKANVLFSFAGFTDIAFNPRKSLNCQARSAAMFVALSRLEMLKDAVLSFDSFLEIVAGAGGRQVQPSTDQMMFDFE